MRKLVGITALFAGLALLFSAGAMPAYADPGNNGNANAHGGNPNANPNASGGNANDGNANGGTSQTGAPNGANGTVKIHDWPEHKNSSDMANDPKVCQFEIHGFKFDSGQTGRWWIQEHKWGNGDASKAVLSGSYGPANANGDWTSGPYRLADGHYKLFVEMTHTAGNSGKTVTTYKHKVFKVECVEAKATPTPTPIFGGGSTPTPTPTPTNLGSGSTPTPTPTPTPAGGNGNNTQTGNTGTDNSETGNGSTSTVITVDTESTAGVTVRTETTTIVKGGQQTQIMRIFNNDVLVNTIETRQAVAGFESAPVIGQIGFIVELAQQPAGVAGSESAPEAATVTAAAEAPLAALASLPATSTGTAALGAIGLAMTALGVAMLKRQPRS